MERGKKRKHNLDLPRITYHASDRTFERLFKEESLGEMEAVVRRKLGLPENTSICLAQLREGKPIDLEDDDDFDAFYSIAHSTSSVNVRVTVVMDATSSSGAPTVLASKKKTKTKTVLAVNTSVELPHSVADNEQIVMADEGTPPCATEKETDTRKRKNSVVRTSGDSGVLEGTSKPHKKRKKDKSGSVAVSETFLPVTSSSNNVGPESERIDVSQTRVTSQIDGKETSVSVARALATSDQSSSISKNARRRKKLMESQAVLAVEPPACLPSLPATEGDSIIKKPNKKNPPKTQGVPFAEQLASAISETSEHNRKHLDKLPKTYTRRIGEKRKDPSSAEDTVLTGSSEAIQGTSLKQHLSVGSGSDGKRVRPNEKEPLEEDVIGARKKKANAKSRASTADELEAANADVKAAFSRILAAKRALSLADNSPIQHSEETDVPYTGQHAGHSETATPQPTLNGKSHTSQYSDVVSEPSSSRALPADRALKARDGASDLTTNCSSSRSSSGESEDQNRLGTSSLPIVPVDTSLYADVDLDALIRGPKVSVNTIADVPSTASSEDEQGLDLAEDDEEIQTSRRGRRIAAFESSEEDVDDDDDNSGSMDNNQHPSLSMDSRDSYPSHPDEDYISFQLVDRLGKSQEVDNSGDVAFHAALAADTAMFHLADHNDATPPALACVPDTAEHDSAVVQLSESRTCVADLVQPPQTEIPVPGRSPREESSISCPESGSGEKQRGEGIIRRMKGRSGRCSGKDPAAGTPTKYDGQPGHPGEFEPDLSTAISMDENSHKQRDRCQPVQQQANEVVKPGAEAFSQNSMSLDTWTILRASSPIPDAESTIMIDELRSSSPGSHSQVNTGNSNSNPTLTNGNDPLFILTESQPPFPYSQWSSPKDYRASNDSEDEQEVHAAIQQLQPKTVQPPKYRRLTDIASQHGFFSTSTPKLRPARSSSNKLADMYGRSGADEIESDSDTESDSDSEAQVDSHIPKSRIAGVSSQTR